MALNPHILVWAREAAGLSVDEAAHALGFKNTQERTAAERLQAMELGKEEPSRSVLLNMARVYHRSLLVFISASRRVQAIGARTFGGLPVPTPQSTILRSTP